MTAHPKPHNVSGKPMACNYAALLGAVLDVAPAAMLEGMGLSSASFQSPVSVRLCIECGEPVQPYMTYCDDCRWVPIVCEICGKLFTRRRSLVNQASRRVARYAVCSKHCQGKYVGANFGFAMHPENAGYSKYSVATLLAALTMRESGVSYKDISSRGGIPIGYMTKALRRARRLKPRP